MARTGVRNLLSLPQLADAQISADGSHLAYVHRRASWDTDRRDAGITILACADGTGHPSMPIATLQGNSPRWSPTEAALAFLARSDSGVQELGLWKNGKSRTLCQLPQGSHGLQWSSTGEFLSVLAPPPAQDAPRPAWTVLEGEGTGTPIELWLVDAATGKDRPWSRLGGHIADYQWSPCGTRIVCCTNSSTQPQDWDTGSVRILSVGQENAPPILAGRCRRAIWSPKGDALAVERLGVPTFVANPLLEHIDPEGEPIGSLPLPDDCHLLHWTHQGILSLLIAGCSSKPVWIRPDSGQIRPVLPVPPPGLAILEGWWGEGCSLTDDARSLGAICFDVNHPGEAAVVDLENQSITFVTDELRGFREWKVPPPEVITWHTDDGIEIEGVLVRPSDADRGGPRPLVVVLHGGPTAMSSQAPMADNDWIWAAIPELARRGAYTLLPNYRGSVGYGDDFRAANAPRLGLVNEDDIVSGIDHLVAQGLVDATKVAALGASHGGYLAAFVAAHSGRVATAVMRSGIADWRLNALLNSDPDWERQYFSGSPDEAGHLYAEASVLSYIEEDTPPMLIIHGEEDRQAPVANARALHRSLLSHGVAAKLLLYHGVGHGGGTLSQTEHSLEETLQWLEKWIGLPQPQAGGPVLRR